MWKPDDGVKHAREGEDDEEVVKRFISLDDGGEPRGDDEEDEHAEADDLEPEIRVDGWDGVVPWRRMMDMVGIVWIPGAQQHACEEARRLAVDF